MNFERYGRKHLWYNQSTAAGLPVGAEKNYEKISISIATVLTKI
jgi:hypothetical protein